VVCVGERCCSFLCTAQVENEDLVFTLETMVDKFGDEIAPYAVSRIAGIGHVGYVSWAYGSAAHASAVRAHIGCCPVDNPC
jgi:hypothetical protein